MIKKYLYLIKNLFSDSNKHMPKQKEDPLYIGSIEFLLTKTNGIDIMCSIPEMNIDNIENVSELAEKYAWFLLNITDGLIVNDIIKELKKHNSNSKENAVNKLFVDNVLFFWHVLFQENQKKIYKQLSSNDPLINPSSVFAVKGGV